MIKSYAVVLLFSILILAILLLPARAAVAPPWEVEVVDPDAAGYLSLAIDQVGNPRIAYHAYGDLGYAWHDAGVWNLETVEAQPGNTGWYPSLQLDAADNANISYYSAYSETLMYASHATTVWQTEMVGDTYSTAGQTSLALDSNGLPHIAYFDYDHGLVQYAWNDSSTWHYEVIDTMTSNSQFVSLALALDSGGQPHLCYYDADVEALVYTYRPGSTWLFDTVDADVFYNGQECDIELDSQDRPHISYSDLYMFYTYHDGMTWHTSTVDDTFAIGRFSSLALDTTDDPHIVYTGWINSQPVLLYAYSAGFDWHLETVDSTSSPERFEDVSLALGSGGRPHVAYWALSTVDVLKYAVRGEAAIRHLVYLPIVVRHYK
ncbi:MAG: hypothetical protein JXA93_19990 [Anaerolineae bacterium]|nr:hypothetical protein [Anaerolineae bacterium]